MQSEKLRNADHWVAVILRTGAYGSIALLLLGLLLGTVLSVPLGSQIMRAGIVLLLATPVLRILTLLLFYLLARDWKYAIISLVVLLIVLASSLLGIKM